jgi:hypothetical protein
MHWHTELWKSLDARSAGKGWGTEVAGYWYWYESWIAVVEEHCREHADMYKQSS